jgi:hypothetical protein
MTIAVVFNGSKFFIEPNPAVVASGTPVNWALYYDAGQARHVRWTLTFRSGTPFQGKPPVLDTVAPPADPAGGQPSEAGIDPGPPAQDGFYKDDIRVEDAATGKDLGNDDPYRAEGYLVVRGISDHADKEKNDAWRQPAADNAMIALENLLVMVPAFGAGPKG